MEIALNNHIQQKQKKKKKSLLKRNKGITAEDFEIVTNLEIVKRDLDFAQQNFEIATNRALVDSFTYEIMSLNKKYEYYIKICKERGLIAGGF